MGSFLQEDSYRGDGLNLYAYCAKNPVVYYDPSGYATTTPACGTGSNNAPRDTHGKEHLLGENGTQLDGSITTGRNIGRERVDVENPAHGSRAGDIHYHEPDNTKWRYDPVTGNLVSIETKEIAPPRVRKVLKEDWFKKAIKKGLNILGEEK